MAAFATPGPITATVEVAGARVLVSASDRTDTVVQVEPVDPASRRDVKVAGRTRVAFADGHLTVKTTVPGDKAGSVAITIGLPAGSDLTAYLAYSDVRADGPAGACQLHMASGRVRLEQVAALRGDISAGEIEAGHITGPAGLAGAAFTARIGELDGPAVITSSSGSVWLGRANGGVTATTGSGAIRIGRLAHGEARLMTGSGDIEVGIGDDTAASLDVTSERGAVRNTVTAPANPAVSRALVTVRARTRHGDIDIHPAGSRLTGGRERCELATPIR